MLSLFVCLFFCVHSDFLSLTGMNVCGSKYLWLKILKILQNVTQKKPGACQKPAWPTQQTSGNGGRRLLRLGQKC